MKSKKRISLLAVLICVFALVFALGLMSACGNTDNTTASGNWFYGTEAPADGLGNNGDFYLNTETLTAYAKSDDGTWTQTTLYSGKGIPANDAGEKGDLYLDIENGVLYQKGESLWTIALKLQGEKGRDGILWFSGDTDPTSVPQGAMVGDFYLNNKEFTVWQLHAKGWEKLGSIKGDKGDDASQLYNGNGAPTKTNPENPKEGDLYLGVFKGIDEDGAGYRLYRYQDGEWNILMDTVVKNTVEIHSLEELIAFSDSVANGNTYAGKEVHLKEDIHFETTAEASSMRKNAPTREAELEWKPIGSADHPFMGTFDGEGHTIYNFKANATANQKVGFFGAVKSATIEHLRFVEAEVTATGSGSFGAVVVGEVQTGAKFTDIVVESSTVKAESDAKVGGLVGKAEGAVTVEQVDVSAGKTLDDSDGKKPLVGEGEGNVTLQGSNTVGEELSNGFVEKQHLNGESVESTTYEILSVEGLKAFRDSVNGGTDQFPEANSYEGKTVVLANNIDLNNELWTPIGTGSNLFKGTFDGTKAKSGDTVTEVYTISNLKINLPQAEGVGLFSAVGDSNSARIQNFALHNVDVLGQLHVGAVLGGGVAHAELGNGAVMDNVKLSGDIKVEGNYKVGGIAGATFCQIHNCTIEGNEGSYVKGTYLGDKSLSTGKVDDLEGDNVGGIIGFIGDGGPAFPGFVSGCHVSGVDVSGTRKVGGVVGYVTDNNGVVNSSFTNGTVESNANAEYLIAKAGNFFIGGIIGEIRGDATTPISGNKVENATIRLVELHSYTGIDPAILGGSRNMPGSLTKYENNTVGKNVTVEVIVNSGDELVNAIKAANDGKLNYITLGKEVTYEAKSSSANGQLLTISSNAIIDLNGQTLSLADTDDNGGNNCGLRVGASVTSLEIKNGHITYTKKEHDDGTYAKNCAFLNWSAAKGTAAGNLTFDHVQIEGNALYAKGADYQHHLKVTVKNHCNMVSEKDNTFFLWDYVDFIATDSDLGKMTAETSNAGISVTLTKCIFAGTDAEEGDLGTGFHSSVIFKAEDTTITGDIQFSGTTEATIKGGSIGGKLVIGGDKWNPTKVTLIGTKCNQDQIKLLDDKSTLTIDDGVDSTE